jgi:hypothetical protein
MSNALDLLTTDLDWREAEIGGMRVLLSSTATSETQRKALLRAAWAMLYAHYEGFCKSALTIYFDEVNRSGVLCSLLPIRTRSYALAKKLAGLRSMTNDVLLAEISQFQVAHLDTSPDFPEVNTESNLWPNVLINLLKTADLGSSKVEEHELKLKTLVGRRNDIAHGKNSFIPEVSYYLTYETVVYDVIYDLAIEIDKRLRLPPFSSQA